ncbi:hypothetical protein [Vibrio phage BONAISHI]|nr:hypothetical protein [Vibrio phage BONAISHI]
MKPRGHINSVIVRVKDITKLKQREGLMFEPMLASAMRYILQGEEDAEQIVSEMREDGFESLVKPCSCHGYNPGCGSCEHLMQQETIVYNFITDLQENMILGPGFRDEISKLTMRNGLYDVDVVILDPGSIELLLG